MVESRETLNPHREASVYAQDYSQPNLSAVNEDESELNRPLPTDPNLVNSEFATQEEESKMGGGG